MNVWLIHPGELLPVDGDVRLNRYGILAQMLSRRGHTVTIWAPTFVHTRKAYRCPGEQTAWVNANYRIELLHVPGYRHHIGLQRYRFNRLLARRFAERAPAEPSPDVILSGIPAPELCEAAVRYGQAFGVPVIVDVRDLWPDAALDYLPAWSRPAASWCLRPLVARNRRIFRGATGITGVSEGFRDWGLRHAGRKAGSNDAVFHLGYPASDSSASDKEQARLRLAKLNVVPDGTFRCFFMASIGSLYDLETVIAAARELQSRKVEKIQFVLCGDGPRLERLRALAEGADSVVLPGWAKAPEVDVLMEMSDIGTIPYRASMHTALPNKAVACFSAGLPVLSSAGGEFASILERRRCGITYQPESVPDFVRAFERLRCDSALRRELSRNACRFYQEELDAERVYSRMIDFLGDVARRHGRRAA